MLCMTIPIALDYAHFGYDNAGSAPSLAAYLLDHSPEMASSDKRPAVIICPGGGYTLLSDREGEPVAMQFAAAGMHSFVLRYSVKPAKFPCALLEAAWAVATVRAHAAQWHLDPDRIFLCGFSAGGHLAASTGVLWNRDFVQQALGACGKQARPTGMILSYPVISPDTPHFQDSFTSLLGEGATADALALVSLDRQVASDTPPAFIWHTVDDDCVDVEHPMLFAAALRRAGVPFEMHLYPHGPHGLSLASALTGPAVEECRAWIEMAIRWCGSF